MVRICTLIIIALVATRTGSRRPRIARSMAFGAIQARVGACQRKRRFAMVKNIRPVAGRMTGQAG